MAINGVQIDSIGDWPDLVLELDDEVRVLKIQSTTMDELDHIRFYLFVKLFDSQFNKTGKDVNLSILSTVEESKRITRSIDEDDVFTYDIVGISAEEHEKIIEIIGKYAN